MNKTKIKLNSPEEVVDFINLCSSYNNKIMIYRDNEMIDAKSIIEVFSIREGTQIDVEMLGSNKEEIKDFLRKVSTYEVQGEGQEIKC